MSNRQRAAFAAIAALIAVVAVIVLAGADSGEEPETAATPPATTSAPTPEATTGVEATGTPTAEPTPEPVELSYANGEVQGGVQEIEVEKGDRVAFTVTSDTADHVHVHGYDVLEDVEAGGTARISFAAEITGVFEVELENARVPVATVKVTE